jgi:membrane dipeptidase
LSIFFKSFLFIFSPKLNGSVSTINQSSALFSSYEKRILLLKELEARFFKVMDHATRMSESFTFICRLITKVIRQDIIQASIVLTGFTGRGRTLLNDQPFTLTLAQRMDKLIAEGKLLSPFLLFSPSSPFVFKKFLAYFLFMRTNTPSKIYATFFLVVFSTASVLPLNVKSEKAGPTVSSNQTNQRDEKLWQKALKIHRSAIVIDGHNDITSPMVDEDYDLGVSSLGKYHTDLARLKQGGMTGEFFSIYVSGSYAKEGGSMRRAIDLIDAVYRAAEKYPDQLMMATTVADIRRAKRQGKIAALMGIEGGHAIEDSLSALREFYRLGARYMTLTHNNTNNWADSSRDAAKHNGLTDFGKEVVREMNRLGMLVDVSHVSDKTMSDALDVSKAPIIASHSSARALSNHPRNIPDELLKRFTKNGGVVMVNFYPAFIDQKYLDADRERDKKLEPQINALREQYKNDPKRLREEIQKLEAANPLPKTPLSVLIDHIDHIVKVSGVDHVGIGSDFDGVPSLPEEIKGVQDLPVITYELLKRGYSEQDIKKILGENFLRAFAEVERVARIQKRQISGEGSMMKMSGK